MSGMAVVRIRMMTVMAVIAMSMVTMSSIVVPMAAVSIVVVRMVVLRQSAVTMFATTAVLLRRFRLSMRSDVVRILPVMCGGVRGVFMMAVFLCRQFMTAALIVRNMIIMHGLSVGPVGRYDRCEQWRHQGVVIFTLRFLMTGDGAIGFSRRTRLQRRHEHENQARHAREHESMGGTELTDHFGVERLGWHRDMQSVASG